MSLSNRIGRAHQQQGDTMAINAEPALSTHLSSRRCLGDRLTSGRLDAVELGRPRSRWQTDPRRTTHQRFTVMLNDDVPQMRRQSMTPTCWAEHRSPFI